MTKYYVKISWVSFQQPLLRATETGIIYLPEYFKEIESTHDFEREVFVAMLGKYYTDRELQDLQIDLIFKME